MNELPTKRAVWTRERPKKPGFYWVQFLSGEPYVDELDVVFGWVKSQSVIDDCAFGPRVPAAIVLCGLTGLLERFAFIAEHMPKPLVGEWNWSELAAEARAILAGNMYVIPASVGGVDAGKEPVTADYLRQICHEFGKLTNGKDDPDWGWFVNGDKYGPYLKMDRTRCEVWTTTHTFFCYVDDREQLAHLLLGMKVKTKIEENAKCPE